MLMRARKEWCLLLLLVPKQELVGGFGSRWRTLNRLAVGGPRMGPPHPPPIGGLIVALLVLLLAPPLRPSETVEPLDLLAYLGLCEHRSLDNPQALTRGVPHNTAIFQLSMKSQRKVRCWCWCWCWRGCWWSEWTLRARAVVVSQRILFWVFLGCCFCLVCFLFGGVALCCVAGCLCFLARATESWLGGFYCMSPVLVRSFLFG